jgi:hypothetical protein
MRIAIIASRGTNDSSSVLQPHRHHTHVTVKEEAKRNPIVTSAFLAFDKRQTASLLGPS